jgi:hypothetical protein
VCKSRLKPTLAIGNIRARGYWHWKVYMKPNLYAGYTALPDLATSSFPNTCAPANLVQRAPTSYVTIAPPPKLAVVLVVLVSVLVLVLLEVVTPMSPNPHYLTLPRVATL